MVCLARHGRLFKVTHLIGHFELETNYSPKRSLVQTLSNPINICLINLKKFICYF